MQVRILGCSGAIARYARTTSFLLDDRILIVADVAALGWAQRHPLVWLEAGQRFDF